MHAGVRAWLQAGLRPRLRAATALDLAGLFGVALAAAPALAVDKPAQAGKKDKAGKGKGKPSGVSVSVSFSAEQRSAVQAWYVETYGRGNYPPALAKKNNGCLPPGQAKKRYLVGQPCPPASAKAGFGGAVRPPRPEGYLYVTLDGDLLKLAAGTLLVGDAIDGLLH